uniref:Uncharacterized protein n=1 Tax=Anguilla anguilla TaxID=7936 RepID=A0A0E9T2J5_ANGAN
MSSSSFSANSSSSSFDRVTTACLQQAKNNIRTVAANHQIM